MKQTLPFLLAISFLIYAPTCAEASDDAAADFQALEKAGRERRYTEALKLAEAFIKEHKDDENAAQACAIGGDAGRLAKEYGRCAELYRTLIARFPDAVQTPAA